MNDNEIIGENEVTCMSQRLKVSNKQKGSRKDPKV